MSCKLSGSFQKGASSLHEEANFKTDPPKYETVSAYIDITTVEQNMVKIMKNANKQQSYWYNISLNSKNSLCALLGLNFTMCEQVMQAMNLHTTKNGKTFPKKNLLESWLLKNEIEATVLPHRKKGSERQLFIQLGTSVTSTSLQHQIKNNTPAPTISPATNVQPSMIVTNTPIEINPNVQEELVEDDDDDMLEPELPIDESLPSFKDDLSILLRKHFPLKSQFLDEPEWYDTDVESIPRGSLHSITEPILLMLKCVCRNNIPTAVEVLKHLLTNKFEQNISLSRSIESIIARNIKRYFVKLTKDSSTKKRKTIQDEADILFKAAIPDENETSKIEVMKYFDINNYRRYEFLEEATRNKKRRKDNVRDIALQCVNEYAHGEEGTRIDTNQFKFIKIQDDKHPYRIWNHMYWSQRLEVFKESNTYEKYKQQYPSLTIGKTRFREFICPCIKEPKAESCVNIPMDDLSNVMFALGKFVRTNNSFRKALTECACPFHTKHKNFENVHNKRPDEILKLTLCDRLPQPYLISANKIPKLFHPNCVNSLHTNCNSVAISNYPTYSEYTDKMKCVI